MGSMAMRCRWDQSGDAGRYPEPSAGRRSARAPGTRTFHAGDLAGLLHVAIREQFEQLLLGVPAHAFGQMLDDEAGIGCDLVLVIVFAHETDGIPMVVGELDVLAFGQDLGYFLVPVSRFDQITFRVAFGQIDGHGSLLFRLRCLIIHFLYMFTCSADAIKPGSADAPRHVPPPWNSTPGWRSGRASTRSSRRASAMASTPGSFRYDLASDTAATSRSAASASGSRPTDLASALSSMQGSGGSRISRGLPPRVDISGGWCSPLFPASTRLITPAMCEATEGVWPAGCRRIRLTKYFSKSTLA